MIYQSSENFPVNQNTLGRKDDGMPKREDICNIIPGGKDVWDAFSTKLEELSAF